MEFRRSAFKHGVVRADIVHAIGQALVVHEIGLDEDPLRVLVIGPTASGDLLEVIWLEGMDDDEPVVIHAMKLRKVFHHLLREENNS